MRETMNEVWAVLENDPNFEFVPYYLGALLLAAIVVLRFRHGNGGGDGGWGGDCGGGGGDGE